MRGLLLLAVVIGIGFVGYLLLGLSPLDALYQTLITVSTVGYREVGSVTATYQWFSMGLIVVGVSTALYVFGVAIEAIIEGRLLQLFGRRRMEREIARVQGHIVLCGAGRVGRELLAGVRTRGGRDVVVVDLHPDRHDLGAEVLLVEGDATHDDVLRRAGLERADVLVAALSDDALNVYVTLAARSMQPDLFIVARAHDPGAEPKLVQAGADRVVNPQYIGGRRMAAYALQPNVAEFLDVVVHDVGEEWRIEEITLRPDGDLAGRTFADVDLRRITGAMVLAVRDGDGRFHTNPPPDMGLVAGDVLIVMGTAAQLADLEHTSGHGGNGA